MRERRARAASTAALALLVLLGGVVDSVAAHSVARRWNEALLEAIRNDYARPTVHARNLFHLAVVMYDAWAVYDPTARPYLLNRSIDGFRVPMHAAPTPGDVAAARETAISHAAYRLLVHRFRHAPESERDATRQRFDDLMHELGHDPSKTSTDYRSGSAAALGNYIADRVIAFGLRDGANEAEGYDSRHYRPVNPGLDPARPGNPQMVDPNRWQPLTLSRFVGQAGFESSSAFVGPEWGSVLPFALRREDRRTYTRGGHEYHVYHDPGPPPELGSAGGTEDYQWGFALVAAWSAHLDPTDGVAWDISPGAIGGLESIPSDREAYADFYDFLDGGDPGGGHEVNPHTGAPYAPNVVPRADYARVLAEFWADGPDSETPPGHWFTILNGVVDHPDFERRYRGRGSQLDPLEWDVKAYFALGGAMHDAAVAAWGVKGWYDYVRPVSALRCMAEYGQSTDATAPNHHPGGLPLVDGVIEVVGPDDPLAGAGGRHVGALKVRAWRGPFAIDDPAEDTAGVGWILVQDWWPYQRPDFVTPPFAGYVSGHSTFSRAAAEVLTLLTGDPFFPGGMGEFEAPRDEFLVFERGPSVDVTLQWATYRDAADQCSLSRIWGGIHPPADDLPGRRIGAVVGLDAFALADSHFRGVARTEVSAGPTLVFPNPVRGGQLLNVELAPPRPSAVTFEIFDLRGRRLQRRVQVLESGRRYLAVDLGDMPSGVYFLRASSPMRSSTHRFVVVR